MNYKTIEELRYLPPYVLEILKAVGDMGFIAGGMARRAIMGDEAPEPEDIDVFVKRADLLQQVWTAIEALGYTYQADVGMAHLFLPGNAVMVRPDLMVNDGRKPIQLIKPAREPGFMTTGTVVEVIDHFAFRTEQFAVHRNGGRVVGVYTTEGVNDTRNRVLHLNLCDPVDPVTVAWRAVKYGRKGYSISRLELLRLFEQWRIGVDDQTRQIIQESFQDSEDEGSFPYGYEGEELQL